LKIIDENLLSNDGKSLSVGYYLTKEFQNEVDYEFFSILKNEREIGKVKELHESKNEKLISMDFYDNILCLYNFKTINNIGIVYDDSKYTNFLERVPSEFLW
jgi:hypothetical protein